MWMREDGVAVDRILLTTDASYTPPNGIGPTASEPSAGYTYKWDLDNDGLEDTTSTNFSHSFELAGTYPIRLTVSDGMDSHTLN